MNKILIILPFLLFTLLLNTTFATVSHERKELKEITHSARKLGHKTAEQVADFTDSIRRFAGNNIGAVGNIDEIAEASSIISKKSDYILGKATGSAHNIERSKSMLRQMERIGLPDTSQTRGLLKDHLIKTLKDPASIKDSTLEGGRVLRESLISGKNGHLKVESIWDGNKLITIKLKGGR